MYAAAMIAAAFSEKDPLSVVNLGMRCIPEKSRLSETIQESIEVWKSNGSFDEAFEKLMAKYGHYNIVHTINNAAIVTLAILYGEGDFSRSICLGVSCGLDTDCNGATIGSIVGTMVGITKIDRKWTDHFNDSINSALSGISNLKISDLAERTLHIIKTSLQQ